MALWWLGNLVLIFVVAPVCLLFLNRVLRPIFEIKRYVDYIQGERKRVGPDGVVRVALETCVLPLETDAAIS